MTVIWNENNELIPSKVVTSWRTCIYYRNLNKATLNDYFPLPFIGQILDMMARKQFYGFLGGYTSYNYIVITHEDQEKITFTCPCGIFVFIRMPSILCDVSAIF